MIKTLFMMTVMNRCLQLDLCRFEDLVAVRHICYIFNFLPIKGG